MNFTTDNTLTLVEGAAAGAQTLLESDAVDMASHDAVTFLASLASIASTGVVTLQAQGRNDPGDAWANLNGASLVRTASGTETNVTMALEVVRPRQRYVRVTVARGTANAALNSIIAIRKAVGPVPVAQGAGVYTAAVLSPAAA